MLTVVGGCREHTRVLLQTHLTSLSAVTDAALVFSFIWKHSAEQTERMLYRHSGKTSIPLSTNSEKKANHMSTVPHV